MTQYVENPPHVDEERMLHIRPGDLLRGFGKPADNASDPATAAGLLRPDWTHPDHPRPARDVTRWAARASQVEINDVIAAADALIDRGALDFTDRTVGRSLLYGLHYLGDLTCLVQAHAATGDPRYAASFAQLFEAWYASRESVRGDWPGLDVIWYSLGVSVRSAVVSRALLQFADSPQVSDECWLKMLATLVGGARWLTEEHTTFRHGNWQFGAACALLQIAALVPDHAEAASWLTVARQRIEDHLVLDVYADGGHYERAPSYHLLCLSMLQDTAIVAEAQFGWALATQPRFTAMHDWLIAMSTVDGWVPPFNDSHIAWIGEYLLLGHYLLRRPDYKYLVDRWLPAERIRSVLSWLPARDEVDPLSAYQQAPAAPAERDRSTWLATSRYAVHRTGWSEQDLQLVVNCGPMVEHELETHSHIAALDFVLIGNGRPLLWEAGGPANYDEPDYYSWYRSTAAHNTVLVPGHDLDDDHEAVIEDFIALPELDVLTGSHGGWGTPHRRSLLLVHGPGTRPYLVVADHVAHAEELIEVLHSPDAWQVDEQHRCRTDATTGVLVVQAAGDHVVDVQRHEGVASYPDKPGHSHRGPLHGLRRTLRGPGKHTVIVPFHDTPPQVDVEDGPGVTVHLDGHTDRFGEHSWLRQDGQRPVAGAAWRATALRSDTRQLCGGPGVRALSARWDHESVTATIESHGRAVVTLFAPHAAQVTINGVVTPGFSQTGDDITVTLPSQGRWQVRVDTRPA